MEVPRMVLVPHTHWDREWYAPFEVFLGRLVEMMDALIELLMADERFAHFHLDGQTAMIDDYLEVRPEREADLRRLATAGRLSVGPWFTQMDEFLVSGESLVRNLEWGLARGRELGASLRVGYLPDQFGHIGQMPQILRREGIDQAVVWRGVPSAVDRTAFWWQGPDGSRVLAEYLAFGYSIGMKVNAASDADELASVLSRAAELLQPYAVRDRLLVTVGSDHHGAAARLPSLLEEVAVNRGTSAQIGSIAGYLKGPAPGDIPEWRGELRSAARAHLLPGVYSNRAHQKRTRARAENLVERMAEPLAALVPGFGWPGEELEEAWRLLLWNGAHDSVCGCSVDEVASSVEERYARVEAISGEIVDRALGSLASRMSAPGTVYFNPSPFDRDGVPGLGWAMDVQRASPLSVRPMVDEEGRVRLGPFHLQLVDEGDVGDLYTFCPAAEAPPQGPTMLEVQPDGEVVAAWEGLQVRLRTEVGPVEGSVHVRSVIHNERPDHRLRLHLRLDGPPSGSVAISPFEVVQRPLVGEGGTETPSPTWPARGAAMAGNHAVTQIGVFEYEVTTEPSVLAVTLMRCVGTISRPHLATRAWAAGPDIATPQAQMPGELRVDLGLWSGLEPDRLPEAWERLHLPMATATAHGGGDLPRTGSLLGIENAMLSSVRKVDGRIEVRVWNPTADPREARVGDHTFELAPFRIHTIRVGPEFG